MSKSPVGIGTQTQDAVPPVGKIDTSSRPRDDNARPSSSETSGDYETRDKDGNLTGMRKTV